MCQKLEAFGNELVRRLPSKQKGLDFNPSQHLSRSRIIIIVYYLEMFSKLFALRLYISWNVVRLLFYFHIFQVLRDISAILISFKYNFNYFYLNCIPLVIPTFVAGW